MPVLPHDISDLHLAPVVLALDARVQELSRLEVVDLSKHVALVSDQPERDRVLRESALLVALAHAIDLHGWNLAWDPRGVKLSHGDHHVVLGAPPNFADYLAGTHRQRQSA